MRVSCQQSDKCELDDDLDATGFPGTTVLISSMLHLGTRFWVVPLIVGMTEYTQIVCLWPMSPTDPAC